MQSETCSSLEQWDRPPGHSLPNCAYACMQAQSKQAAPISVHVACMSKTGCEPGYKKVNQDNCFAFEKYITPDQALFRVMDGHGPNGRGLPCRLTQQCSARQCSAGRMVGCNTVKRSAVQRSEGDVQCNAVQCSVMQCSARRGRAGQCNAVHWDAAQCSAVQCIWAQHNAGQCMAGHSRAEQCSAFGRSAAQSGTVRCSASDCVCKIP